MFGANARIAQRDRLIQRSHAQPVRAFGLKRARTLHRAVPVGIGLHHGAHSHTRSHMLLHRAKVLPQSGQGDFRPGGTRRHAAQDFCCASHFRDYSGSSLHTHVTPGLLPAVAGSTGNNAKPAPFQLVPRQKKIHRNLRLHLNGLAVENVRTVAPLADGLDRRGYKHGMSRDNTQISMVPALLITAANTTGP